MKRLFIITLTVICLVVQQKTYAAIRNGYDNEVEAAQKKLQNLNEFTKITLSKKQRKRLKEWQKVVYATAKKLRENQAQTQALIDRLRIIAPELYDEINSIQDCEGNITDVYIKVVDKLKPGLEGATNVNHCTENLNVYNSEYGDYTVSVKVVNTNPIRSLQVLVHELGHVRYQVPHLKAYTAFYKQAYYDRDVIGHLPHDPSHQSVVATMKSFIKTKKDYYREIKSRSTLASIKED